MQLKKILLIIAIALTLANCNRKQEPINAEVGTSDSGKRYGLTDAQRRQLYIESSNELHKLNDYLNAKQKSLLTRNLDDATIRKQYELLIAEKMELMKAYRLSVTKKYHITEDQEQKIYFEGLDKHWPVK